MRSDRTEPNYCSGIPKHCTETAFERSETEPTLHMGSLQWLTKIPHEGLVEVLSVESPHGPRVHVESVATEWVKFVGMFSTV